VPEPPPYLDIAARLRGLARTEPPGSRLPSERELAERFGVSRPTISRALALLRAEGLVEIVQGAGAFVRPERPLIRLGPERLSRAARLHDRGGFRGDSAIAGRSERVDIEVRREPAGIDIADRLAVDPGVLVLARVRTMYANDQPIQLAQSYMPLDLAEGTRLTEPNTGPGGTYARIEEILAAQRPGGQLGYFVEEVTTRAATAEERASLRLAIGVPVIRIVRTAYSIDDRPVEVCDVQAAGDRYQLVYRIPAD
jgi:GntR family transcriptional regulator